MRERPILFNDEMVRALLGGRKTQTRRVVKMPPSWDCIVYADWGNGWWPYRSDDGESPSYDNNEIPMNCPYGRSGDRLWVRETWWQAGDHVFTYPEDDEGVWSGSRRVHYAADGEPPNEPNRDYPEGLRNGQFSAAEPHRLWRKRPSIHMPRWASRILLEVVSVRVERLKDISPADAEAEGLSKWPHKGGFAWGYEGGWEAGHSSPTGAFSALWKSIGGHDSWEENPWVWVVEFKRIDQQHTAA